LYKTPSKTANTDKISIKLNNIVANDPFLCYYKVLIRSFLSLTNTKPLKDCLARSDLYLPHCKNIQSLTKYTKHGKNHIKQTFHSFLLK
jgi:hypothetical protein|tara:strand:+ start:582 stop:848 length:267 start_codon:yes stop_codon:yes gene_type:complete